MKQLLLFLALSTTVFFVSCEGDPGPPGEPGINILGQVFEVTVDFTPGNNFSQLVNFPSNVEVFESDAVLVYLLEDVVPGNNGSIDVWSQLPQTFFVDQGTLVYNFDHTFLDVRLFLDGNFDLSTLGSAFTNDQTFRIAVVPSEFANSELSMEELLKSMQIENTEIQTISN
ncbi:collagen-like protein [Constantimarinum furrinae]|uniref:Collagen-like protein n=1 Tax=Constantimarinum furrinae TaxID=2562285 RepID=A0A7G8PX17_9FLAO|nr:collagen-like protein [Constantimarinum furrinae]QNJ98883.1 hypothetical protein ALE3EI_2344 [Constantimarinum furrinae]